MRSRLHIAECRELQADGRIQPEIRADDPAGEIISCAVPTGPFTMHYRVNAGPLPPDHWVNDPEQGGGRILGEMCHFVDLLSFICARRSPISVQAKGAPVSGRSRRNRDHRIRGWVDRNDYLYLQWRPRIC